jgi:hypothetical protein
MKTPRKVRAALLPPKRCALGLALRPCSARHYIALEHLGSPVVGAGDPPRRPTLGDYATAALLLSLAPAEAAALAADPAALARRVGEVVDSATVRDLQAAAAVVLGVVSDALGLEPAPPAPPHGGEPADTPPDPR